MILTNLITSATVIHQKLYLMATKQTTLFIKSVPQKLSTYTTFSN